MNVSPTLALFTLVLATSLLVAPRLLQRTDASVVTPPAAATASGVPEALVRDDAPLLLAGNTACNPRVKICEE